MRRDSFVLYISKYVTQNERYYKLSKQFLYVHEINTRCLKTSITTLEAYANLFRGRADVLNYHNVAKNIKFYLG
jgi:hypothetical protein